MNSGRVIITITGLVGAVFFAHAASADTGYDTCMETAMTSYEMSQCGVAWNKRAENSLAKGWRAAMDSVGGKDSEAGKSLLTEQRAWIKFKDLSCGFYYANSFGSMHRSVFAPQCRNKIIETRASQLADIAAGLEVK